MFKIKIRVVDDSGSVLFVLFDRDVSGLFNKSCFDIIESNNIVVCIFSTFFIIQSSNIIFALKMYNCTQIIITNV